MVKIGVLAGGGARDEVTRQLAPLGAVEWFACPATLVERAVDGTVDVVVAGTRDEQGRSIGEPVVELAAQRPTLPVVLHTKVDRGALDDLLAVFALGLRMECVVRPFARFAPAVQHVLSPAYRPGVAPLLLHHFLPLTAPALTVFVTLAMLTARERRSVAELAAWTGVSTRTIERRFLAAGWPPAFMVLHSFTALDAVWLMTEYRWSAQRVQHARRFGTASSVTRLLAAYAGTRPSTVMADGGFAAALAHVTHRLVPAP